jgi:hypothetical protein
MVAERLGYYDALRASRFLGSGHSADTTLVLACLPCPDDSTAFEDTSTVSMLADDYRRDADASRALDGGGHRAWRMWGLRCRLASF